MSTSETLSTHRIPSGQAWPAYLLFAYIAALPFMTVAPVFAFQQVLITADLIFLLVSLAAFVSLVREQALRPRAFELLLIGYLLAIALSAAFSEDPPTSAPRVLKVAYLVAVAFFSRYLLSSRRRIETAISVWLTAATVTAAASLAGVALFYAGFSELADNPFLRDYGSLPPGRYPRVGAFFFNVNMLCNYLLVSVALAWYRWRLRPASVFYPFLVAALCGAALFTFSTGIGGLVLMLALLLVALPPAGVAPRPAIRRATLAIGVAVAVTVLAAAAVAPGQGGGGLEPSIRLLTWRDAWNTFLRYPLLGQGPGLAVADVPFWVPSARVIHFKDGHNIALNLAAQSGVIGVVALAGLLAHVGRAAGLRLDSTSRELSDLGTALAIALAAAWLYHGLTGSFEDARHLWVLLGLSVAATDRRLLR